MSRLGNKPVKLPSGVKLNIQGSNVNVEGPKGKITKILPTDIKIEVGADEITFVRTSEQKKTRANHGMVRSIVSNMVKGVSEGFEKRLQSIGVGYRMNVQGNKLNISVGYSHPVVFDLPEGVTAKVSEQTKLALAGIDLEVLGSAADKIRKIRPPEPYKGKGIRYEGEHIQLKEGKAAGGAK